MKNKNVCGVVTRQISHFGEVATMGRDGNKTYIVSGSQCYAMTKHPTVSAAKAAMNDAPSPKLITTR